MALCAALAALATLAPRALAQHGRGGHAAVQAGGGAGAMDAGAGSPGASAGGQRGGANAALAGPQDGGPRSNAMGGFQPLVRSAPRVSIPGRFWDDKSMARTLKLRPDQMHRMDAIFEANRSSLVTLFSNLQREEAVLSSLSPRKEADQTKVFAAIDRVAQARADLEKEKLELATALRHEMDEDQVQQLDHLAASSH